MKINYFIIYAVLVRWAGLLVAIVMPILFATISTMEVDLAFYNNIWLTGSILAVLSGGYILWDERNNYGQIAGIFLVVGTCSLLYALYYRLA